MRSSSPSTPPPDRHRSRPDRPPRRPAAGAPATLVAAGLAAVLATVVPAPAGEAAVGAAPVTAPEHPAGHGSPAPVQVVPVQDAPPSDDVVSVRDRLQALLGEHVLLTVELLRARVDGEGLAGEAALGAVERNADGLAAEIGAAYGQTTAQRYGALWSVHVRQLSDYAIGHAEDDAAARAEARDALHGTERDLAALLAEVTGGDEEALHAGVAQHHRTMLRQADAYAGQDWDASFAAQREGFGQAIETGSGMAAGIAASRGQSTAPLQEPRRTLQSALSRLLAEHVGLLGQAMRSVAAGGPDARAAGRALNDNSQELGQAVAALYGEEAAERFLDVWGGHVETLVRFAGARAEGDAASSARTELQAAATSLASFLSGATGLPEADLVAALTAHEEHLTSSLTARLAGDEARGQEVAATGYRHMFDLSQTLAVAIGNRVAARLPVGGAQTGGGGAAGQR